MSVIENLKHSYVEATDVELIKIAAINKKNGIKIRQYTKKDFEWVEVIYPGSNIPCYVGKHLIEDIERQAGYVYDRVSDIKHDFIRLAFNLWEMQKGRKYHGACFYDYVEKRFQIPRSTTTKLISVLRSFNEGSYNDPVPRVRKHYEEYSYSQLEAMLPLSADERKQISPLMTVKAIKEIRKSETNKLDNRQLEKKSIEPEIQDTSMCLDGKVKYGGVPRNSVFVRKLVELKTIEEIENFLNLYRDWLYWIAVPSIGMKIFRFELGDGNSLLATSFNGMDVRFKILVTGTIPSNYSPFKTENFTLEEMAERLYKYDFSYLV